MTYNDETHILIGIGTIIMRIHIAILKRSYLSLILEGQKRLECRLTKISCPPFGQIAAGEKVLLKESGGPVRGQAEVKKVLFFKNLTPDRIDSIYRDYNDQIYGADEYWQSRRNCRYCTLIRLKNIKSCGPYRLRTRGMRAWLICNEQEIKRLRNS